MSNSGLAAVNTQPKTNKADYLDPRATRFGMSLIWSVPTHSSSFYVWEIEANKFFPFRPFIGEVVQLPNGKVDKVHERLPEEQVADMYTITPKSFLEFPELDRLLNEEAVSEVAGALYNPNSCSKYADDLKAPCATCWYQDLLTNAPERVRLIEDAAVRKAAKASLEKLKAGLANAIVEARRLVDESIKHIDEKKKSTMNEWDLQNIYHIHGDRPQYRTATSSTTDIQQLASAILEGGRQRQAPEIDIAAIVAKAVADATAPLAAKLEAYEAKKAELEVKEQVLDKATSVVEQIKAKKDGK